MIMRDQYFLLTIDLPLESKDEFELFLWENISSGWEEYNCRYKIYFSTKIELDHFIRKIKNQFPSITYTEQYIKTSNWAHEWKKFFKPIKVGKFVVLPSWEQKNYIQQEKILPIFIYPEMAFGTGHHETTRLCLKQIERLYHNDKIRANDTFLDIGTGSGILGIALSKLGLKGIGLDIDPLILTNCKKNIQINTARNFSFFIGTTKCISNLNHYNLITANILLEPLIDLKNEIFRLLTKGGFLIVSGILINQEITIIDNYRDLFNDPEYILRDGEWSSILWKRS